MDIGKMLHMMSLMVQYLSIPRIQYINKYGYFYVICLRLKKFNCRKGLLILISSNSFIGFFYVVLLVWMIFTFTKFIF